MAAMLHSAGRRNALAQGMPWPCKSRGEPISRSSSSVTPAFSWGESRNADRRGVQQRHSNIRTKIFLDNL
jgi:hypothetical protein